MESFEIEAVPQKSAHRGTSFRGDSGKKESLWGTLPHTSKWSWWDFWNPWKCPSEGSSLGKDDKEEDHESLLQKASHEDFSDLEMLQFLQTGTWSREDQPVVLIIAKHLPIAVVSPERLYRFVISKLEALSRKDYQVVYVHTESSYWSNSPGFVWLWRAYNRFPSWYRSSMKKVFIVHPDIQLHASMWFMCRWMSDNLWSKVQFCLRVEYLWDEFEKGSIPIPSSVYEHDQELEESPLMDYGIITNKEWSPPGGPDLSRYQ